jgi:hypothetical protein
MIASISIWMIYLHCLPNWMSHENDPNSDDLGKPSRSLPDDDSTLVGNPGALDETVRRKPGADTAGTAGSRSYRTRSFRTKFQRRFTKDQQPYPTPPQSPPVALLAATIQGPESIGLTETLSPNLKQEV